MTQTTSNKIVLYTFRTFPHLEELRKVFPEVIVFGRIKEGLEAFYGLIAEKNPDLILGVAKSISEKSYFEPKAMNCFNNIGKVEKYGKEELNLYVPPLEKSNFNVSASPSDSFCNYTMYKIKSFLEKEGLDASFAFSHIRKEHIADLPPLLANRGCHAEHDKNKKI